MKKRHPTASLRHVRRQPAQRPIAPEAREALERGAAYERRQALKEALVQYMQALSHEPRLVHAWLRVAYIFLVGLHWQRGMEALETVLQLEPNSPDALRFLAFAEFNLGRLEDARNTIDRAAKLSNESSTWVLRAWIHSNLDRDPDNTLKVYREWGSRIADPLTARAAPLVVADRSPRRRLKVGYVTADFRRHSIAFFMLPVLQHHNADEVEVHVFSSGGIDDITMRMQPLVHAWHNVTELDYEPLYEYIRAQRIDVLVDLSGHTLGERLLTFARRAAPVQVTWLGFMNSLGMLGMDYRLTDYGASPPGSERHYTETLFRLNVMASYSPPPDSPLMETPPMLRNGYPTLISLNNSAKLTDEMLRLWNRILERRADARLVIMVKEHTAEDAQDAMQHRVEAAGMPLDRVFVMHQQPLERFMELGHIADVGLDTSPISGGTTTLHSIWMGIPVVCMDAERATDSSTARTIEGLGFGGAVGKDADDYVEKALAMMEDVEGLVEFRRTARERFQASELMNYPVRTAELERAYRLMWLNYLVGEKRWLQVGVDLEEALREVEGMACEQA